LRVVVHQVRAAVTAAQGDRAMADRLKNLILRSRFALEPGAPPYVLTPDSTSFDSRGP
jgi:hypothetical protein